MAAEQEERYGKQISGPSYPTEVGLKKGRFISVILAAALGALPFLTIAAPAASASASAVMAATQDQYRIAWTDGGFAPRTGTSMSDPAASALYRAAEDANPDDVFSAPRAYLPATLTDGTPVTPVCETTGDTVVDSAGYSNDLWDEVGTGGYVPNAYIDTGANGPTPGVPQCRYNRLAAILWALQNVTHPELVPGGDCTWFASQAGWAGGLPQSSAWAMDDASGVLGDRAEAARDLIRGGYSPDAAINPTTDATTADDFFTYFESLINTGLVTIAPIDWSDNTADGAQLGDFIAYDWQGPGPRYYGGSDGTIDHIAVVTYVSPTTGYPSVSQHTGARVNRFWSWAPSDHAFIDQDAKSYLPFPGSNTGQPQAYLIHING